MIIEKHASSVAEVFERIKEIRRAWNPTGKHTEEIWFRGQPNRSYKLTPGLYRPEIEKYRYDEITIFTAFKGLAAAFASPRPSNDWEWYFLAQHYQMPTRLLDWTENALAAIYYATSSEFLKQDEAYLEQMLARGPKSPIYDEHSPTIWMLDPGTLNWWSHGKKFLFGTPGDYSDPYLPEVLKKPGSYNINRHPVAIHVPRSNPRIIAQQGTFIIFGRSKHPIDEIATDRDPQAKLHLACIMLDRNNLAAVWDNLQIAGVGELTLFPELDSVAKHVTRSYQRPG